MDWLDKHIREQAAHYGVTPERLAAVMHGAAEVQEQIENEGVDHVDELRD